VTPGRERKLNVDIHLDNHFHFGYLIWGMEATEHGDKQVIQAKPRKDDPIPSEVF
jgi:hypothetical protein